MEAETQRARLRSLTEQAQQMVEQSHRLAQRADALAARWHAAQAATPPPVDYDAVHLATELETLNTELTSQLELERTLALAERTRLAAILEAMGDAVLVVDAAGSPLLTNRAYHEVIGPEPVSFEDDAGEALPESATPRRRAAQGESFTLSCVVRRADGRRRWCEATGRPVPHSAELQGVVVLRDITERTLLRLQEEFLALASHELRTPLTPARGYLEMVPQALAVGDAERAERYAATALEQVRRLDDLVGDLLDVGRLSGEKLVLGRQEVDLGAVVRQALLAARITAEAQRQQLTLEVPEAPLLVCGDAGRLEQVTLNLLTNALTYAASSPTIAVRLRREAQEAVLEVQDAGPGIPSANLPHLFSRFYQVARRDRPSRGGLGLGLYLVQQLVEAHGGTVGVTSTVGHGTTFTVHLPLLLPSEGRML